MIKNLLNKSINVVYQSFTKQIPRPKITFLKCMYVKYKECIELPSIISILQNALYLFYLQNIPKVDFKLYCKYQLQEQIDNVHSINNISHFNESLPVIAVYVMGNVNEIKFISLKTQTIIKVIKLSFEIITISFHTKYFGIACKDGNIRIYDNNILSQDKIVPIFHISSDTITKVLSDDISNTKENDNKIYNIVFDMSDNCIMYYISWKINEITQKEEIISSINNNENTNMLETIAIGTYQGIKDFTNWGIKSINDYNTLFKSKNTISNKELININNQSNNTSIVNVFNITNCYNKSLTQNNSNQIDINELPYQIHIPQFKDGINSIKQIQNGKYIIIGNFHNQVFYIFELYPQTNKKYNINYCNNTSNRYKVVYSLFRGITKCNLNSLDLSPNAEYSYITSHKGTHHLYYLQKRDNQINENINNVNISNDELINLKIIEGKEISKYKYEYYSQNINENCSSIHDAMFITIDAITIDDNFSLANYNKVVDINRDKSNPYVQKGNFLFMITDDKVNAILIVNKNTLIPLNTFSLNYEESNEHIRLNVNMLTKQNKKMNEYSKQKDEFILDDITTDLSNFATFQVNPLFTFNKEEQSISFIKSTSDMSTHEEYSIQIVIQFEYVDKKFMMYYIGMNNVQNELHILNELCLEDKKYVSIKRDRKGSNNSNSSYNDDINGDNVIVSNNKESEMSMNIEEMLYKSRNDFIESNIKEALNSNINELIKIRNTIVVQEQVVIKDNYY